MMSRSETGGGRSAIILSGDGPIKPGAKGALRDGSESIERSDISLGIDLPKLVRPENLGPDIKMNRESDGGGFTSDKDSNPNDRDYSLHFRFEGDGYDNGALRRNAATRLTVSDLANPKDHATATGSKLKAVALADGTLTVLLTVPDGVKLVSEQVVFAKFQSAALVKEVGFDFVVMDDSAAVLDFRLDLYAAGKLLYAVPLSIAVSAPGIEQPDRSSGSVPHRPLILDLDAPAKANPSSGLLLSMSVGDDGLSMTLVKNTGGTVDSLLTAKVRELSTVIVQTLLDEVRNELGTDYYNTAAWTTPEPGRDNWREDRDLLDCCERVASAGSLLYQAIANFEPCRNILEYIDTQPTGTRLTIATSGLSLPVEILYPRRFSKNAAETVKKANPAAPDLFWGLRYAVEMLQSGPGNYREMRARHWRAEPEVSFNLNSTITSEQKPDPMAIHQSFARRLQKEGIQCSVTDDCVAMKETLLAGNSTASVIYVYCHGSAAVPSQGQAEALQLDYDCFARPRDAARDTQFANAPVVILNACLAGSTSPLMFTGFLKAFREQGALGVIAATFYVPIQFGAKFGAELVEACLLEGPPLSEKVRVLRNAKAARGNFSPLFYSVQCQLDR